MAFKVCLLPGAPDFETLHAAKLTEFPLEKRDYKPFSQARICFSDQGLHVQFHSFEAESLPQSEIRAVLRLTPESLLVLSLFAEGRWQALAGGVSVPEGALQPFSGEDLQGVYWGGTFTIPHYALNRCFHYVPRPGDIFAGNFYKLCHAPEKPHYGSFFPADFRRPLNCAENLGEFLVIDF